VRSFNTRSTGEVSFTFDLQMIGLMYGLCLLAHGTNIESEPMYLKPCVMSVKSTTQQLQTLHTLSSTKILKQKHLYKLSH